MKQGAISFPAIDDALSKSIIKKQIDALINAESLSMTVIMQNIACFAVLLEQYNVRSTNTQGNRTRYDTNLKNNIKYVGSLQYFSITEDEYKVIQQYPVNIPLVRENNMNIFGIDCDGILKQIMSYQTTNMIQTYIPQFKLEPTQLPTSDWFIFAHYYTVDLLTQKISDTQQLLTTKKDRIDKLNVISALLATSASLMDILANSLQTPAYINDSAIMNCLFNVTPQ